MIRAGHVVLALALLVGGMVFDLGMNGQEVLADFAKAFIWEPPYLRDPAMGGAGGGEVGPAHYTFDGQVAEELPPGLERLVIWCVRPGHVSSSPSPEVRLNCGEPWRLDGSYRITVTAHTREQAEAYARQIGVVFGLRDDRTGILSVTEPRVRPHYVESVSTDYLSLYLPRDLDVEVVSRGSLSLESLDGSLTVFNIGDAVISDVAGPVRIEGTRGRVSLSGLRAATEASVKMGSLRVALDRTGAGYAVTASLVGSLFTSDFPLDSGPGPAGAPGSLLVTGTVGAGEIPVDIEVTYGSLEIVEGE